MPFSRQRFASFGMVLWSLVLAWWTSANAGAPTTIPRPPILVETPTGRAVVLYEDSSWRLVRHVCAGYLDVFHRQGPSAAWTCLDIALDWRRNTYPIAACGDPKALHIIGYDVVANVPSGRRLENLRNGVDIDRITVGCVGHPTRLAEGLEFGGIDSRFEIAAFMDGVVIAGTNRIATILPNRPPAPWNTQAIEGREIVEIAFRGERAAAILRRSHDDRKDGGLENQPVNYEFAKLDPVRCETSPVPDAGVPWRVRWDGDEPSYDVATGPENLASVLLHDVSRMPHGSVMDLGGNNLEGRVAWSQAYYLNGILSILTGSLPRLAPEAAEGLKARALLESRLIAELVNSSWPGLRCQRYSIGRESLNFALHAGRTLELLCRAQRLLGPDETIASAVATLRAMLDSPTACVEVPGWDSEGTQTFETLRYRKRDPFWADGCNVPFNYVSGVVSGLLADEPDTRVATRCEQLMQPLLCLELRDTSRVTWRYWWGVGDAGWDRAQGVSLNTPIWVGDKSMMAHISYRSIDAMAVLALARSRPGSVTEATVAQIRDLTARGWLWPLVNQELSRTGEIAHLSRKCALYHARAAAAFQLQSQPWAIEALIKACPP